MMYKAAHKMRKIKQNDRERLHMEGYKMIQANTNES